jgi:uncharacterized protein YndB with AHSA1/START domain
MEQIPDTIEREILINAPVERVWELVSEPGWFINAGQIRAHGLRADPERDHVTIVTDPEYGDFSIETVSSTPPQTITFRWLGGAVDEGRAVVHTDVVFTLTPVDAGTMLRVVESGWAAVEPTEQVAGEYRENSEGWDTELAAARAFLEHG